MGAIGNSKAWIPYINSKECSKQICTLSCPQWCYIIFPPPPPPSPFVFLDDKPQNRMTLSPLVIAVIGVIVSAFLLVSYYAIISKYCRNSRPSTIEENHPSSEEIEDEGNNNSNYYNNYNESNEVLQYEPWFISTSGLEEGLIKKISMVKYKKGEGLIESVDCLICLGEFNEGDNLRLLPKCSHAFHVDCIDTWLKSHSNCPLCRANVVSVFVSPVQPPPTLVVDIGNDNNHQGQDQVSLLENHVAIEEISSSREGGANLPKCPFRSSSHLARLELRLNGHVPYNQGPCGKNDVMRRSISMGNFDETTVSISDIFKLSHGKDYQGENSQEQDESSKSNIGNCSTSRNNAISGGLLSVVNSYALKRSFSSGRFLVSKYGRKSHVIIPL
ncbi:hypothetical protein vseg_016664 [Gypsophila vaccaria]